MRAIGTTELPWPHVLMKDVIQTHHQKKIWFWIRSHYVRYHCCLNRMMEWHHWKLCQSSLKFLYLIWCTNRQQLPVYLLYRCDFPVPFTDGGPEHSMRSYSHEGPIHRLRYILYKEYPVTGGDPVQMSRNRPHVKVPIISWGPVYNSWSYSQIEVPRQ